MFRIKNKAVLRYEPSEPEAVQIAIDNLEQDLRKVLPEIQITHNKAENAPVIHIKTDTALTDKSGQPHKEMYRLEVRDSTLYITGSDRRGTVYGIYTFCEWMGVSPWYFFADVPVSPKTELVLPEGHFVEDWPSVEYRGIFINDEEELDAWVRNYMGEATIGVKTYEKIFELLLRLKANYIWPAMHVNSFNMNPENGALADRMGIVVGTSHCDMLMRSNNREWKPWTERKGYTDAVYDYSVEGRNREILKEYWRESVEQNRDFEVCYTLGMRGIHDSGFETRGLEGTTEEECRQAKIALLEKIIADQRDILRDTLGRDTMMTFIPYKEVMELYDHGLKVPEDMTLVWANDNYGYIRRYPSEAEKKRSGGNGIYYHNSYWAPPGMSYVFLCSIPLAHTRNELQKAWNEGIRKLWVMNVGAMKPLEQEITFYLQLAWEIGKPGALTEDVEAFVADWIDRTFSGQIGQRVSKLLNDFSQLTNVRKLEQMDYDVFSQTAYGDEAAVRIQRYEELFKEGNALFESLPEEEKPAFFQLVLMRIHAGYFTNLAYYYADRSTLMFDRGNMQAAALYTEKSQEAEDARRRMLYYYNNVMRGGKWQDILTPEGFPPPRAAMMPACTPPLKIQGEPAMRVDIWNDGAELRFATPGEKWLDIGNTGVGEFAVCVTGPEWAKLSPDGGIVREELRVTVSVEDVGVDRSGEIVIENLSDSTEKRVPISTVKPVYSGCVQEDDGIVVIEASEAQSMDFKIIKRLGRLQGDLVEAKAQREPENMRGAEPLCYEFALTSGGQFLLEIHRFPSLNSVGRIRIGVSVDDGAMRVVESVSKDEHKGNWRRNVLDNVDKLTLALSNIGPGAHILKLWALDKYFAFSRVVLYTESRKTNSLAGVRGAQSLPERIDLAGWCAGFYGEHPLLPRPEFFAPLEDEGDCLADTLLKAQPESYAVTVTPDWYFARAKKPFAEREGNVKIDMAAALAQTEYAWAEAPETGLWRHCAGESFGRSGLAMYIRKPDLVWEEKAVPSLNYRIECAGGEYTLWLLSKFNFQEESSFGIGVEGEPLPKECLYGNGSLWRYEAEQIYCWTPVARVELVRGEHTISVYALASGMRFDRLYMTNRKTLPPQDLNWGRDE